MTAKADLYTSQLQIRVSPAERRQLRKVAKNRGLTSSALVRAWIYEAHANDVALGPPMMPKKSAKKGPNK